MRPWLLLLLALIWADPARAATIVRFETVLGDFEVELFDEAAPLTVANFLAYVRDGDYDGSFIHRSIPGFVVQGGGFGVDGNVFYRIPDRPPVTNEFDPEQPLHSNLRGRISMAKAPGDPHSATNQWFINVANNAALDNPLNNGGYTGFGQVLGEGMAVVDAIAALPTLTVNLPGTLPTLQNFPLFNYSGGSITTANLVTISSVTELPEPGETVLASAALASVLLLARLRTRRAGRRP
jgi:cyclophilin family peptidyl-prolyl cis-trans isomerase